MRVTMLGPPGSGKGTQADVLAAALGVSHVVSSDLLHEAAEGDDGGAKRAMADGNLVDDETVIDLVTTRLDRADTQNGFVLDGFPRNATQAEALDVWLAGRDRTLDAAVVLDVPRPALLERLARRAEDDGREDDDPQTREHRLDLYDGESGPLLDHYDRAGKLRRVDADGPKNQVHSRALDVLDVPRRGSR